MVRSRLERRFAPWLDVVGGLLRGPGDLAVGVILGRLHETFGTNASWNWINSDRSFGFQLHLPIVGWPGADQLNVWGGHASAVHPLIQWFTTTGDLTAMSLGRVPAEMTDADGFETVRDELLPVSIEQQLSIPYRHSAHGHRAFLLVCTGEDFSDEDLVLARRIQPLLILLARQAAVTARQRAAAKDAAAALDLTGREVAVLTLLGQDCTAAAIGHRLGISPRTVHVHLDHLYRKLGVHDRMMAVRVAREWGLLSSDGSCAPAGTSARRLPTGCAVEETASTAHRAFAWRPGEGSLLVSER
jgi:DNA-binding NarL/FixJ family response regulator